MNDISTLENFLYQTADHMRQGDHLVADEILPTIDQARDHLENLAENLEKDPSPTGLEAIDGALIEAYNLFAEALDLLELAVEEDVPSLASEILIRTQDAQETLREVRRQAEFQSQALQEESGLTG